MYEKCANFVYCLIPKEHQCLTLFIVQIQVLFAPCKPYITRQTQYTGNPLSLLPPLDRKKCELINTRVFTIKLQKSTRKRDTQKQLSNYKYHKLILQLFLLQQISKAESDQVNKYIFVKKDTCFLKKLLKAYDILNLLKQQLNTQLSIFNVKQVVFSLMGLGLFFLKCICLVTPV